MVAASDDFDAPVVTAAADAVDDAVVRADPPRPPAGEIAAQRLGFPQSRKRVAAEVVDEALVYET